MKNFKGPMAALALWVALLSAANAAVDELPGFAYDMVSEVTFASTADSQCDGIKSRPGKLQSYIINMYAELAKIDVSATDAAKHFETETARNQIAARENALRTKHGIAAEGIGGLCAAIRAEAKVNRDFAKLMRIR